MVTDGTDVPFLPSTPHRKKIVAHCYAGTCELLRMFHLYLF